LSAAFRYSGFQSRVPVVRLKLVASMGDNASHVLGQLCWVNYQPAGGKALNYNLKRETNASR